jgi:hypothetical protein
LLFPLQVSKLKHIKQKGRHSSVVEQLIRNQQARGSTPRAGSNEIKGLAILLTSFFVRDNPGITKMRETHLF